MSQLYSAVSRRLPLSSPDLIGSLQYWDGDKMILQHVRLIGTSPTSDAIQMSDMNRI